MIVVGALFVVAALSKRTRLGGAFAHGKAPSVPIGSVGRLIILVAAAILLIVGVRALIR